MSRHKQVGSKHKNSANTETPANADGCSDPSTQASEAQRRRIEARGKTELLQVFFNGLLVAFTLALAIVSVLQWYVTRQNMEVANRAYLGLSEVRIYCPVCSGPIAPPRTAGETNASIGVVFTNAGNSPAMDIDQNLTVRFQPGEPLSDDFNFTEQPDGPEQQARVFSVQPSTQFPLHISRCTRAEFIAWVREQRWLRDPQAEPAYLYAYGHVSYTDYFRKRHTLVYCAVYKPPLSTGPEAWTPCSRHNEEYEGNYDPSRS